MVFGVKPRHTSVLVERLDVVKAARRHSLSIRQEIAPNPNLGDSDELSARSEFNDDHQIIIRDHDLVSSLLRRERTIGVCVTPKDSFAVWKCIRHGLISLLRAHVDQYWLLDRRLVLFADDLMQVICGR